jgi:hypothetical protein
MEPESWVWPCETQAHVGPLIQLRAEGVSPPGNNIIDVIRFAYI